MMPYASSYARFATRVLVLGVVALGAFGCGTESSSGRSCVFGVISDGQGHLEREAEMGVDVQVVGLSWREYLPSQGQVNEEYVDQKRAQIEGMRKAGFDVILSLGYHDTPPWVHENYDDSYYVNQFGSEYDVMGEQDAGDANLVFNPQMRGLVDAYMHRVFEDVGTDFYAVRLGGGRYGELTYPPANYGDQTNLYWAYDRYAQEQAAEAGVDGWRPGDPSPDGEARRYLDWYLNELAGYQNWQVDALRSAGYPGRIMMLYPSWGIRPGQIDEAVGVDLDGSTSAEINGEVQRGLDFARQVRALEDDKVILTTTWLDASGNDAFGPRHWSPVKYLASLAERGRALYGENTGSGSVREMELSARRMQRYGLEGMVWYDQAQLYSGRYAGPSEYSRVIDSHPRCG